MVSSCVPQLPLQIEDAARRVTDEDERVFARVNQVRPRLFFYVTWHLIGQSAAGPAYTVQSDIFFVTGHRIEPQLLELRTPANYIFFRLGSVLLQDTRLDNRVLDLRTPANQAIF